MEKKVDKINIQLISPLAVILFIVFFVAKIFDKIDWSWWWVFSPLWIPTAFVVGVIALLLLALGIINILDKLV